MKNFFNKFAAAFATDDEAVVFAGIAIFLAVVILSAFLI